MINRRNMIESYQKNKTIPLIRKNKQRNTANIVLHPLIAIFSQLDTNVSLLHDIPNYASIFSCQGQHFNKTNQENRIMQPLFSLTDNHNVIMKLDKNETR